MESLSRFDTSELSSITPEQRYFDMSGGEQQAKPDAGRRSMEELGGDLIGALPPHHHRKPRRDQTCDALAHSGILMPLMTTGQPRTRRSNCASATSTNTTTAMALNGFMLGLPDTVHYRHQMLRGLAANKAQVTLTPNACVQRRESSSVRWNALLDLDYLHHCLSHGTPSLFPSILVLGQCSMKYVASSQEVI